MIIFEKYNADGALVDSNHMNDESPAVFIVLECQSMVDRDERVSYGVVRDGTVEIRLEKNV